MASVQFSGIGITAMNGKIGADIVTRNFYGPYKKVALTAFPSAPTTWMTDWQTLWANIQQGWHDISDSDRQAWIDFALVTSSATNMHRYKGNNPRAVRLSGFDLFCQRLANISLTGAPVTSPTPYPDEFTAGFPGFAVLTFDTTSVELSFPDIAPNCVWVVYASAKLPVGRMSINQVYRCLYTPTPGSTVVDIIAEWITRTGGTPSPGAKYFFRVDPINSVTGQRGSPFFTSAVCP